MSTPSAAAARVHASAGRGVGGHLLAVRLHPPAHEVPGRPDALDPTTLAAIATHPGICGAHALIADAAVTTLDTAERALREPPDEIVPWTLLLEGTGEAAPAEAWEILRAKLPATTASLSGHYTLQTLFTLCDLRQAGEEPRSWPAC